MTSPTTASNAGQLKAGAVGLTAVIMQGIGHTAPATAILLTLPFIAQHAGRAAPAAYATAFFIVLALGVCLSELAREMPSAGGYYTYVSRSVHPRAGFLTSWLFFLYAASSPAISLAIMGHILSTTLETDFGVTAVPWWAVLLAGTAFTTWVTYRGITASTTTLVVLGAVEMSILVALGLWGLVSPGEGGVNLSGFSLGSAPSGNGFYLGVVFSIFALTGWDAVVPLAEESRDPTRTVPRALLGTIFIISSFLVFNAWAMLIGWGTERVPEFVSGKEGASFILARKLWGRGWLIVLFALLNSILAVSVAASIVSTRMWFAMARTGSMPAAMARLHPRYRTPVNAIWLQVAITLGVGLGLGFTIGPDQEFYVLGVVMTLALALIYSTGNLGVYLHFRRKGRGAFRLLRHAVLPATSAAAVLWVAVKSVVPLPPKPVAYAPAILIGWLGVGLLVLLVMRVTGREQWLLRAGDVHVHTDSRPE